MASSITDQLSHKTPDLLSERMGPPQMAPQGISDLVPNYYDLATRRPLPTRAQNQAQDEVSDTSPSKQAYVLLINACADSALGASNGSARLREIERGARMITRYLVNDAGLGRYLEIDKDDEKNEELDKEIDATIKEARAEPPANFAGNPARHARISFLDSNVSPMIKNIRYLLDDVIPSDEASVGRRERQAICVAIVAVGVSNFGAKLEGRYEKIKKRANKITELVGAILGMEPHAGTIIGAVATITKTITDAVYDHKIENVAVIKTLGRRIAASFMLEHSDLTSELFSVGDDAVTRAQLKDAVAYTRILASIYGITQ